MIKISRLELLILFLFICIVKFFLAFFLLGNFTLFGGGNDADFYDTYARGSADIDPNVWPIFLRYLNEIGLYRRDFVALAIFLCSLFLVPFLASALVPQSRNVTRHYSRIMFVFIAFYPTLFYYSLDLYRDVCMLVIFLVALHVVKLYMRYRNGLNRFLLIPPIFLCLLLLALFRPYLGVSFAGALVFGSLFKLWRTHASLLLVGYFIVLLFFFVLGLLDPIIAYRDQFLVDGAGGSTFGLDMREGGGIGFPFNFAESLAYQIFGLKFVNLFAVLLFVFETIPFSIFVFLLVKNRRYSTRFSDFLCLFAILYSTVWLIGNDNFGTAARLRIFTYVPIAVSALIVCYNARQGFEKSSRYIRPHVRMKFAEGGR